MKINAVQFVHVKLSYKSLTSKYEKSNSNINISKLSHLPFDIMCVSTGRTMTLCQMNPTINKFIETLSASPGFSCDQPPAKYIPS